MTTPRTGDTITTPEQLGALPNRTAIHDANRELWERNGTILDHLLEEGHAAWVGTTGGLCHSLEIDLPATVLYVPGEQPRPDTDNARAEAERRYPSDVADRGLTYPTGAVREHSQAAFVAGARWATGDRDD